jgi:hypothetical protein
MDVPPLAPEKKVVFPRGALTSMFSAAIMAIILQCGTAAAATIIIFFTPPLGLECRSIGYIAYAVIAVFIMLLNIISTIFARISETREARSTFAKGFTAFIAISFRWISFQLALINGVGLIALCCFQFANFLDSCYCNASVLSRGTDSYIIISYDGSTAAMRISRIVAVLVSGVVMATYMLFLRLVSTLPDDLCDD